MRLPWGIVLGLGITLGACGDDVPGAGAQGSGSGTTLPAGDSTSRPTASGGQGSSGTQPSDSAPDDTSPTASDSTGNTTGPTGSESVRFLVLGDTGEGNQNQMDVAATAETVCAERGCDFALMLGDNFYDVGVTSVDDPQFVEKFETIYAGLDMPFYIVLGNHDYGTLASDWARGQYQIDYGKVNEKWVMPDFWYTFTSDSNLTQFFAMDTQRVMFNFEVAEQRTWLAGELAASAAPWKIGFAHHPYLSNGQHGNAGSYEGVGFPIVNGTYIKEFLDDLVCGQMQVYFSGHDHSRQAFDPVCGTYFFVSGAAAKTTGFVNRDDNPLVWGDDQNPGFGWAEIEGDTFTLAFYDLTGTLDHEMSFTQ